MRAITGGIVAAKHPLDRDSHRHSIAISQVGIDCSGVAPPPITDWPCYDRRIKLRYNRNQGFGARANLAGRQANHRSAGTSFPPFQQDGAQRVFQRLVNHLIQP